MRMNLAAGGATEDAEPRLGPWDLLAVPRIAGNRSCLVYCWDQASVLFGSNSSLLWGVLSFSRMLSVVVCVWWCDKTLNFASYCISNFLSLVIVRYYACLCGHEELVRYLLANGEQKRPDMGAVSFSGPLGFYVLLVSLWKLLLLQPTIWSAISGYRGSPAHTFMVPFAGHLLLEFASWNCLICLKSWKCTEREAVCDGSSQHDFLKSQLMFFWGCSGVGNMLI